VLGGRFPWYRAMRRGTSGPDVAQLNAALGLGNQTSVTAQALSAFAAITGETHVKAISNCQLVAVPFDAFEIRARGAAVGDPASKIQVRYLYGGPTLRAVLPGDAVGIAKVGDRFASKYVEGSIAELKDDGGTVVASIRLDKSRAASPGKLRGRLLIGRGEPGLIVPATALYEAPGEGSYMLKQVGAGALQRVSVATVGSSAGYVEVSPSGPDAITAGDRVLVGNYAP